MVRLMDQNGDERLSKNEFQFTMEQVIKTLGGELLAELDDSPA